MLAAHGHPHAVQAGYTLHQFSRYLREVQRLEHRRWQSGLLASRLAWVGGDALKEALTDRLDRPDR